MSLPSQAAFDQAKCKGFKKAGTTHTEGEKDACKPLKEALDDAIALLDGAVCGAGAGAVRTTPHALTPAPMSAPGPAGGPWLGPATLVAPSPPSPPHPPHPLQSPHPPPFAGPCLAGASTTAKQERGPTLPDPLPCTAHTHTIFLTAGSLIATGGDNGGKGARGLDDQGGDDQGGNDQGGGDGQPQPAYALHEQGRPAKGR